MTDSREALHFILGVLLCTGLACQASVQTRRTHLSDGRVVVQTFEAGVPEGSYRVERADGTVIAEGAFRNGARAGVFRYYIDGTLDRRVAYDEGVAVWSSSDPQEPLPEEIQRLADETAAREERREQARSAPPSSLSFTVPALEPARPRSIQLQMGVRPSGTRVGAATFLRAAFGVKYGGIDTTFRASRVGSSEFSDGGNGKGVAELGAWAGIPFDDGALSLRLGYFGTVRNDTARGFVASGFMSNSRPGDLALVLPNVHGLRAAARLRYWWQQFFYGVDVGADLAYNRLSSVGTVTVGQERVDVFRFAAAAGVASDEFAFSVCTTNLIREATRNRLGDQFVHAASGTIHWSSSRVHAHATLTFPLLSGDHSVAPTIVLGADYDF